MRQLLRLLHLGQKLFPEATTGPMLAFKLARLKTIMILMIMSVVMIMMIVMLMRRIMMRMM